MSKEPPPEEEGRLCVLESIFRAIPVGLGAGSDSLKSLPSPKLNKSEKSTAFPFPLLCGALLFLKVVPVDWERVIGSGRSIRRDFTSEVSLAGDEIFLTSFPIEVRQEGREEFTINSLDDLAGLAAPVDLRAFAVTGIVTSSSPEVWRFRCVFF